MNYPTVCVVTPVYNGEKYLGECIASVLKQDYRNFEYYIVNNCSTDGTLAIAEAYAAHDPRVKVFSNRSFVGAIANHNRAIDLVPPHCKYFKVVSADDWLMPECIRKMVHLAESYPSVSIVGSYQRSADSIKWRGVPPDVNVLSGRDAARLGLLYRIHVLGTPTSVLYRTDLIKRGRAFFPHPRSHADTSACYECLQHGDLGFVHEVLAVERVHPEQWSEAMYQVSAGCTAYLDIMLQYGPLYLTPEEFKARKMQVFDSYYLGLGGHLLKLKGRSFWRFQRARLEELGLSLPWRRVIKAALIELGIEARHPWCALRKVGVIAREKLRGWLPPFHPS
jgi:glycosyltransferase involved in cell wall biosynthesis